MALTDKLSAIGNAIREKTGDTGLLTLDAMPEAIASIGGALPDSITKLDGGSFTPAATISTSDMKIQHNLGVIPKVAIVWCDGESVPNDSVLIGALFRHDQNGSTEFRCAMSALGNTFDGMNYNMTGYERQSLTEDFFCLYHGARFYEAGVTYKWLAWA